MTTPSKKKICSHRPYGCAEGKNMKPLLLSLGLGGRPMGAAEAGPLAEVFGQVLLHRLLRTAGCRFHSPARFLLPDRFFDMVAEFLVALFGLDVDGEKLSGIQVPLVVILGDPGILVAAGGRGPLYLLGSYSVVS